MASSTAGPASPPRQRELPGSPEDSRPLLVSAEAPSTDGQVIVNAGTKTRRCTSLHAAARRGIDIDVQWFLRDGAQVDAADEDGFTPLYLAARGGHLRAVGTLLDGGGDHALRQGRNDLTPLHVAVEGRHAEVVSALLKKGANESAMGEKGAKLLEMAVLARSPSVVNILLGAGADLGARSRPGMAPLLHFAVLHGGSEVVSSLLANGADHDARDLMGGTALHKASDHESCDIRTVDTLLAAGANINATRLDGLTPLHLAVIQLEGEIIKALLDRGAHVWKTDRSGRTPLHLVCTSRDLGAIEATDILLRAGADEKAKDSGGNTPKDLLDVGDESQPDQPRSDEYPSDESDSDESCSEQEPECHKEGVKKAVRLLLEGARWRRRGIFILLRRRRIDATATNGKDGGPCKVARTEVTESDKGSATVGVERCAGNGVEIEGLGGVIERLICLEPEELFRKIVSFL